MNKINKKMNKINKKMNKKMNKMNKKRKIEKIIANPTYSQNLPKNSFIL